MGRAPSARYVKAQVVRCDLRSYLYQCDSCRTRKIRCDRSVPCSNCKASKLSKWLHSFQALCSNNDVVPLCFDWNHADERARNLQEVDILIILSRWA
jgi:hypothetical protein